MEPNTETNELNAEFWDLIKSRIKARNQENKLVESWINPIHYVETQGSLEVPRMVLSVPSEFHRYYVVESLLETIYSEIAEVYRAPFELDVIIKTNHDKPAQIELTAYSEQQYQAKMPQVMQQAPPSGPTSLDFLNSNYTFSTFVVGRNSEFAHAACYNVARNPGEGYNPLLISGPTGMGKTHLLHAVGHEIKNNFPHLKILYIAAERFLNECIYAMRHDQMNAFRHKYRDNCDILLVDDLQFIGRGEATQEEFFHTVNAFIERRKQVVLASDRMPKDILKLDDRNRSRLEWGLVVDIQMPDFETRVAILRYKAEKMNIRLTEDVVEYIARISKRSIRELEGNLKKVKMFSELQGLPIDYSLAKRVLTTHETQTTLSMEDVQKMVADHFKVKMTDLKSASRAKVIVVPRQISMYLIKKHLDKPLTEIGRIFGDRDHTTVMNAIERVRDLQAKDMEIKSDLEELTTRIHNITGL
ncbi:MAG: chromosomal replication initiator protein DnaA [Bdellovibrio sp.]